MIEIILKKFNYFFVNIWLKIYGSISMEIIFYFDFFQILIFVFSFFVEIMEFVMRSQEKIYVFVNEVGMDVSVKQVYIIFIDLRKKR